MKNSTSFLKYLICRALPSILLIVLVAFTISAPMLSHTSSESYAAAGGGSGSQPSSQTPAGDSTQPHSGGGNGNSGNGGSGGSGSGSSGSENSGGTGGGGSGSSDGTGSGDTGGSNSGGSGGSGAGGSDSGSSGSENSGGTGGGDNSKPDKPDRPDIPKVTDIGIFPTGSNKALAYSTNSSSAVKATISTKGGTLDFDSVIYWTDHSQNRNHHLAEWSVDDDSVATISPAGRLTAKSDGTVQVKATVRGSDTDTGNDRVAWAYVKVEGQGDSRYVASIDIVDEKGDKLGDVFTWEPDLSKDLAQFYAIVTVYDPQSDESRAYSTKDGPISKQTEDISDITWYVGDPAMATVDEATGMFRPKVYGGVTVYASSSAGKSGKTVKNSVLVRSGNPNGTQAEGYFPQDELIVRAYYEQYTPADHGDDAYVIDKTYSVSDVESLGTVTQTYTALGGGSGYFTMTGRGVPFATLLDDAGINLDKVTLFNFGSVDSDKVASKSFIFGMNRYYYPNVDMGSYAGAKQVYPIIALESNQRAGGNCDPDYNMLEATRFRLLFGAVKGTNNSEFQRKWIHTITVIYAGAPTVEGGNGDGNGNGNNTGDGSNKDGGTGKADQPTGGNNNNNAPIVNGGNDKNDQGNGNGGNLGGGSAAGNKNDGDQGSAGNYGPETSGATPVSAFDLSKAGSVSRIGGASDAQPSGSGGGKYSVFQIMSRSDNANEKPLDPKNPLAPLAAPVGAGIFAGGCARMVFWYRKQTHMAYTMRPIVSA